MKGLKFAALVLIAGVVMGLATQAEAGRFYYSFYGPAPVYAAPVYAAPVPVFTAPVVPMSYTYVEPAVAPTYVVPAPVVYRPARVVYRPWRGVYRVRF
jgi:hypothetical protein